MWSKLPDQTSSKSINLAAMSLIPDLLQRYADDHTSEENALLETIRRDTYLHELRPRMLSGNMQGRLLSFISRMIGPKYILEIGTYTGYSALCLAEGLRSDGKIFTIEKNEELESKTNNYFKKSAWQDQIELLIGDAIDILPGLKYPWDLVFIDADKENYPKYYELIIDHVRPGGFIIADNVLWSGKVYDEKEKDLVTETIRAFNDQVHKDERVENLLLPLRDGILIARKK